jgi:hypothetical protein
MLADLLTDWAMRSTLDTAAICSALPRTPQRADTPTFSQQQTIA